MVPTSKCLDVGDHICAVVYTTSYVRQFLVGAVYYTARTYIGHDDRSSAQLWRSLSYIRGGITEIGYFASWVVARLGPKIVLIYNFSQNIYFKGRVKL